MIMISCFCAESAVAQSHGEPVNSRGHTSAEILQSHGIDLSKPSLLAALKSANPQVRINAALQLASDHDSDAAPAIQEAFSVEKDLMARVSIAGALGSLQDQNGIEDLRAMCADTTLPIREVIYAVQMLQLFNASKAACANRVIDSLNSRAERDYLDVTITLLAPMFSDVSGEQAKRILDSIQKLFSDRTQQPAVRLAAGQSLAAIGRPSTIEVVRHAISEEEDPTMRSSFQADLTALEKKQ